LKTNKEIRGGALTLPTVLHFENYVNAWNEVNFGRYIWNSTLVSLVTVSLVILAGTLAAYAFARIKFKGSYLLFFLFYAGMSFPVVTRLAPLMSIANSLKINDSLLGLMLIYAASNLPFGVLMMRSFFRQFPTEIEDAAMIDGASRTQFLMLILLPLSIPALGTLAIFTFMHAWNEFFIAFLLITKDAARTLPLGLLSFQGQYTRNFAYSFAGIMISALPVIVLYILMQRSFIKGLTAGSLK
jgi:ABC-type glycerol-3-phosphate transport system permease component